MRIQLCPSIFAIIIAISISQTAFAQNTSPYWRLAGNNSASSSSKLGTTNAISLSLYTKNTTRIFLDTLGRWASALLRLKPSCTL